MTVLDPAPTAGSASRVRAAVLRGGIGFLVAAVLQLLAVIRVVLPSTPDWFTPGFQLLGWLVGGLVLVAASILLGRRTVVSRRAVAALAVSASGSLVLAVTSVLLFAIGPSAYAWGTAAVVAVQLLILAASAAAALAVLRAGVLTGLARWAFVALAAVDAVGAILAVVPPTNRLSLVVFVVARPLVVGAIGAVLVLHDPRTVHGSG